MGTMADSQDEVTAKSLGETKSLSAVPSKPQPQWPGFRFPEEYSVGTLYAAGKDSSCGDWCIEDFWEGGKHRIECQLPQDHEYLLGLPHLSFDHSKAWRAGVITDVWYKDKLNDLKPSDSKRSSESSKSPKSGSPISRKGTE